MIVHDLNKSFERKKGGNNFLIKQINSKRIINFWRNNVKKVPFNSFWMVNWISIMSYTFIVVRIEK